MLFNCKQCVKNANEWFLHDNVCVLSLLAFKMVLMTWRLAQMKVYFSLLCDDWCLRMPKIFIECWIKCKIVIESDLRANDRLLSLMNVTLRNCSPFEANNCLYSHNEQQKVYQISLWWDHGPDFAVTLFLRLFMMVIGLSGV